MSKKPLTTIRISIYNLRQRGFRTFCLVFVVALLSFVLFGGAILSVSMENGLVSLKERLGADLAIVPSEHEDEFEGILLSGEPSKFYFDREIIHKISKIEGVKLATAQFYISSISAQCCSVPLQIIGIDTDTDFVTQPWISKAYGKKIGDGELIAGSNVVISESNTLRFFGQKYPVAAQLAKTSTGMDNSVFANMNTIRTIIHDARSAGIFTNADMKNADIENSISSILIRVADGYNIQSVASRIRAVIPKVSVIQSKNIFSSISESLGTMLISIRTVCVIVWIFGILILAVLFSVVTNERKKEFAVLRILGATKNKLRFLLLTEALLISILGAVIGIVIAATVLFPFSNYISTRISIPYLLPGAEVLFLIMLISLILSLLTGPFAAGYFADKISKIQVYDCWKEG